MGWDNASTIARDVDNPQRNYPRAIDRRRHPHGRHLRSAACRHGRRRPFSGWLHHRFVGHCRQRARRSAALAMAVVAGGVICGVGMFNALMMSYTRLPIAMAGDGMLPRIFVRRNSRGVPWVSVLFCGLAWALALNLPFERLISIDLILYGTSLILEFVALIVLRMREPELPRPFRAGNFAFACTARRRPHAPHRLRALRLAQREARRSRHRLRQRLISSFCLWDCPARAAALLAHCASTRSPPRSCRRQAATK